MYELNHEEKSLVHNNRKIQAIKAMRERCGIALCDAKKSVEAWQDSDESREFTPGKIRIKVLVGIDKDGRWCVFGNSWETQEALLEVLTDSFSTVSIKEVEFSVPSATIEKIVL